MDSKINYSFSGPIWKHNAPGGWHFISLPISISLEIRENLKWQEEGWGRMKVLAETKGVKWETAIWFDTKRDTYILPLKSEIRKKVSLSNNEKIDVNIWI